MIGLFFCFNFRNIFCHNIYYIISDTHLTILNKLCYPIIPHFFIKEIDELINLFIIRITKTIFTGTNKTCL